MAHTYHANQDIRDYMADHCITQRMLAYQIGTSVWTVCNMLKKELSQQEKENILHHIDAIIEDRKTEACEEDSCEESAETESTEEPTETPTEEEPTTSQDVSCTTKFKIGDRVKIPSKSLCIGTVYDIWTSQAQSKPMYAVETEGGKRALYAEEHLEPAPIPIEYTFSATIEDNVAVVCMIASQGGKTWVCARGHAHILHDGEVGMAQAISYASKRMFETLDKGQAKQIYFKDNGGHRDDN
jgi:hypothetical protein